MSYGSLSRNDSSWSTLASGDRNKVFSTANLAAIVQQGFRQRGGDEDEHDEEQHTSLTEPFQQQTSYSLTNLDMRSSIPVFIKPDEYSTEQLGSSKTIRFQVIIWNICSPDVINNRVCMKFRVTMFWHDVPERRSDVESSLSPKKYTSYTMRGRYRAIEVKASEEEEQAIDVPPVSIMNADTFEVVGRPDVKLLSSKSRLMRWSCMYRADLLQDVDDMNVRDFPHDQHNLCLKLGILTGREKGGRWDKNVWKLALANESDTQGSIRVPYGLLVNNTTVRAFHYDDERGLDFQLRPLHFGVAAISNKSGPDQYLKVGLKVKRNSGYYDKNIIPLLNILNLVSISILCLDATFFFQRGLMCLNIAFVEVGLRMSLDSKLPNVGYEIKMQQVLNYFFYSKLWIVIQSAILLFLIDKNYLEVAATRKVDFTAAILLLANQVFMYLNYIDLSLYSTPRPPSENM